MPRHPLQIKKQMPFGICFFIWKECEVRTIKCNSPVDCCSPPDSTAATPLFPPAPAGGDANEPRHPLQKRSNFCLAKVTSFFIQAAYLGISSRFSVYIIAVGVYHHRRCILLRLDEIQHYVLMIYNASH